MTARTRPEEDHDLRLDGTCPVYALGTVTGTGRIVDMCHRVFGMVELIQD
jgi:hypothetical protein